MLSKLIWGARATLIIGVVSTAIGLIGGMILGFLCGMFGGWVDTLIMRIVDILLSVPSLLLAVSVAAVLGQTQASLMIAIGVAQVPVFARLLRASMLQQRNADYVLSAQTLGLGRGKITMSHVLPNSVGPVIVQGTLSLATAVIEAAALSYLGLGGDVPQTAEWGRMLTYAQLELAVAPWLAFLPGHLHHDHRARLHAVRRGAARGDGSSHAGALTLPAQTAMSSSLPGIEASRLRVYGSRAFVKISSEVAASTSCPSFMTHT